MILRSRRRTGRIVAASVIALSVAVVVAGILRYRNVHQSQGFEPTGQDPIPACALDDSLLQQTRTHNFQHGNTYGFDNADPAAADFNAECLWGQTKGIDGVDARSIKLYLARYDGPRGVTRAEWGYDRIKNPPYTFTTHQVSDAAGIGDQASFAIGTKRSTTEVLLAVRHGNRLVGVGLQGTDHGLLWHQAMSADEGKRLTELVARELLRRNW